MYAIAFVLSIGYYTEQIRTSCSGIPIEVHCKSENNVYYHILSVLGKIVEWP